jgi:transposase
MSKHPQWALKYKKKGTELRLIKGKYYLYEITSKWNPQKKRSQKVTLGLLGKITENEGFVESEKLKLKKGQDISDNIYVKEYGLSSFIENNLVEYTELLKKHFPKHWKFIIASAYARLAFQSPLKKYQYHYSKSFLSETYSNIGLSSSMITKKMKEIGNNRQQILNFFAEFKVGNDNILFDGTDLFSNSNKMRFPEKSKTKKGTYDNIVNLMFVFSLKLKQPVYYRIMSGNIKDISSFKLCLDESGISNATIIADKGFYSASNLEKLDNNQLKYIIPLRRNNSLIDYSPIKKGDLKEFDGYFIYEKKIIWYYQKIHKGKKVIVYKNDELKNEEIMDFLTRCETLPEKYDTQNFYKKQHTFGTFAVITNIEDNQTAESIYILYKSRNQIEIMIDVFKNIFNADKTYMQDDQAIEGWMFINIIVMHWYYKILLHLQAQNLNSKYSPKDIINFLIDIKKIKINGKWYEDEITKKNKTIFDKLKLHIT